MAHGNQLQARKRLYAKQHKRYVGRAKSTHSAEVQRRLREVTEARIQFMNALKGADFTAVGPRARAHIRRTLQRLEAEIKLLPPEAAKIQRDKLKPIRSKLRIKYVKTLN